MSMKMWELAAAEDDRLFSPYCWRIRMALAHKGLAAQTIPWRFTDADKIAFSGQGLVPVLQDGEQVVHDSWAIAEYLEAKVPARPLFDSAQAKSLTFVFKTWVETTLHGPIFRAIVLDVFNAIHEKDKAYFRASREKRFGMTLEQFGSDPKKSVADLRTAEPLRRVEVKIAPNLAAEGDARLVRVLLENLIGNAWKFTSHNVKAVVEFNSLEDRGMKRVFFVRDDGAGFDQEFASKLFVPFQRLHRATEFPGTGIGLATVSRIVGRHGGRVWAEGREGIGATFYFEL